MRRIIQDIMKNLFATKQPVVSFEVFPPKPTTSIETIFSTIKELQALQPDFISVTYGAGGSSRGHTIEVAEHIKKNYDIPAIAHLTCISNTEEELEKILDELEARNLYSILALRGDVPQDSTAKVRKVFAKDLIEQVRRRKKFFVVGAAYPEGHGESDCLATDIMHLKAKVEAGTDLLITQIFFDNNLLYDFMEKIRKADIKIPVSAGIMPVFSASQIARICSMCGTSIPKEVQSMMDKYSNNPSDMEKAGLEYACRQIMDLVENKIDGVHLYTMNRPHFAEFMVKQTNLR